MICSRAEKKRINPTKNKPCLQESTEELPTRHPNEESVLVAMKFYMLFIRKEEKRALQVFIDETSRLTVTQPQHEWTNSKRIFGNAKR